ncbi:MAG TPA: DUF2924 domain-containing protein [Gemmataceae bacterium]|nr:DUF2924 domain-containing protein [Gemmataceae bacterium]
MDPDLRAEIAALGRMTVTELRTRYAEVFGEATPAHNKAWLAKRIAWRLQALAEGDLTERARRRAAELANDADLRLGPPRTPAAAPAAAPHGSPAPCTLLLRPDSRLPPPGTVLARPYKGQTVQVRVLPEGFEHDGRVYRSLSAVARAITGSHCNGYLFFRLGGEGGR